MAALVALKLPLQTRQKGARNAKNQHFPPSELNPLKYSQLSLQTATPGGQPRHTNSKGASNEF